MPQPVMLKKLNLVLWRPTRPFRTNTQKRCLLYHRGLEYKSRRSSDTKWSTAKANIDLPRERTGHSKHPLPTTQETTLHMDITITAYSEQCWICGLQRRFRFRSGARLDHSELLCDRSFTRWKRTEKASDIDIRRGTEGACSLLLSRPYIVLPDPLPQCTS